MSAREPHWFEPVADHLGAAYLRYSFTKGTAQEIAVELSTALLRGLIRDEAVRKSEPLGLDVEKTGSG